MTARGDAGSGDVLLIGLSHAFSSSTPSGPGYGALGALGDPNLAWLAEDVVLPGRVGIPCGVGVPCGTTASQGRLFGFGSGYGSGSAAFHGRDENIPICRCGESADVLGDLSREVIRREVRRHRNEITYCYERELTARLDLEGRVDTRFVIAEDGTARSVHATSDTLPETAACVARVVERMRFPESEGVTGVNYPFTFEAGP